MLRFALTCAALALTGFAVGKVVMQPAEASGTAAVRVTETDPARGAERAGDRSDDTTLYLRAGDAAEVTRAHGPLTLSLVPDEAAPASDDPLADAPGGRWLLHLTGAQLRPARLSVQAHAVTDAQLVQLDADPLYEALVVTYSGGAHCCTTFHAFDADGGQWRRDSVGAGSFGFAVRDLDGDGAAELVGEDPRFEYAFGSFAGSRGATRILSLGQGRFRDETTAPRFRRVLLAHRDALVVDLGRADNDDVRRGLLGALVAEHVLLGETAAGFALIGQHLPEADAPLFERDVRSFLREQGFTR